MKAFSGAGIKFGIDIGSSQIRIYSGSKIVLQEASCAAIENDTGEVVGFGTDALIRMHSSQSGNYHLVWAIKNGIMTDYDITKEMLRYFINKATHQSVSRPNVMISVPCELSEVVRHALVDVVRHAGVQSVSLISAPIAAALGSGQILDLPDTILSVVIGKNLTDCGIYCCGGTVYEKSLAFGGHSIDLGICRFLQKKYHLMVVPEQAEQLKHEWASCISGGEQKVFTVRGRRLEDGVEIIIELTNHELALVMQENLMPVVKLIKDVLHYSTPEMAEDLIHNGMLLSGGSAQLPGIPQWISPQIGIPVFIPKEPETVVAIGCYQAIDNGKDLSLLINRGDKYYGGF